MISLLNFQLGGANLGRSLMTAAATVVVAGTSAFAQNTLTAKGVVKDATGEPIVGANVRVKGTTQGAATDLDGKFTIANVKKGASLEISYVGMATQTVVFNGQALEVLLKDDGNQLGDVVVVGYGRQKKVNLTGAVSSVDAKALAARPVQNVTQVLQGMVPGLNITTNNGGGALDAGMNINVRGTGTIGEGSSSGPLVLIDGVEGNMNTLAPTDIENISVLKDASASAIYGSRAAFGVILVTTKSGKEGKARINYNGSVRFSTATQVPKIMDSEMFANYYNRAAANSGGDPVFTAEIMKRIRDYKNGTISKELAAGTEFDPNSTEIWTKYGAGWANTEWFGYFYDKNVPSHEHNVAVSGGSKSMNYYLSGGFLGRKGLLKVADDSFRRFNFTGKVGAEITKWLRADYSYRWTREDHRRPNYMGAQFFHNIVRRWPTNAILDPNGFIMPHNEALQAMDGGRRNNVVDYHNQQLVLTAKPLEGLMIRIENNYNSTYRNTHEEVFPIYWHDKNGVPVAAKWFDNRNAGESEIGEYISKNDFFSGRYYAEYARESGKHDYKVVAGFDLDINNFNYFSGYKKDLITTEIPVLSKAVNDKPSLNGGPSHWATMGMFARLNYAYDGRYLAEFSIRRDGSSRFVGDKRWATFPSFSLGWNVANEAFWGNLKNTIGQFKLRASWGALGNTNIQSLYPWFLGLPITGGSSSTGSTWLINNNRMTVAGAPGIVSASLTWERVQSWNIGFDFAAFRNRLQGTFDYFVRDTKDMVGAAAPISSLLGTGRPPTNNSDLRSKGWEFELRWRDQIKDFRYGAKLILSDSYAVVTKYYNPQASIDHTYEGKRIGDIWGYTTVGIAKSEAEMTEHLKKNLPTWGKDWAEGDVMYKDLNGDGKVSGENRQLSKHGDLSVIGNSEPRLNYSLTLDAAWRGFDFSLMLQGIGKRDFFTSEPYFAGANHGKWQSVGFTEHWDFYRPVGDPLGANVDAYYPRVAFGTVGKNFQTQTRYLQNAAYMRIKNVQLGYTLPVALTKKFGVSSLRVYTSVDNLATFTKLSKIFDPEALGGAWGSGKIYPLQRTWSLGINVGI